MHGQEACQRLSHKVFHAEFAETSLGLPFFKLSSPRASGRTDLRRESKKRFKCVCARLNKRMVMYSLARTQVLTDTLHVHVRTCLHTYMPTYIPCLHTYAHTYIHTWHVEIEIEIEIEREREHEYMIVDAPVSVCGRRASVLAYVYVYVAGLCLCPCLSMCMCICTCRK